MPERSEGLCSTCKHSSRCTLSWDSGQVVHFCEEYETADGAGGDGKAGRPKRGARPGGKKPEPVMGLCSNCIHRDTCRFPRPESGVWHCEEYA